MKQQVLITGAAGFIGRHVALEYAKQGWKVVGIGHGDFSDYKSYGVSEWHRCDISLKTLNEFGVKPGVIIHCAGGASVGFSVDNPAADFDLTVRITSDVLEFIRLYTHSTRLVYLSSAAGYGQVKTLPITEQSPLNPVSPYGVHKVMAELLCKLYSQQFKLPVAILRPFSIFGPGLKKQLLWDACQKIHQGNFEFFGTGEEIRDWLHVDDLANLVFKAAIHASTECPVVNAGCGTGISVKEILQVVIKQFSLEKNPIFSSKPRAGDPNAYIADITSANAWDSQIKTDLREGIANYVEWYKQCQ